jgi:arsenate reductase (glutaredoxin)
MLESAPVTIYHNPKLGGDHWTDSQLIDQMLLHPILINRPIVVTPWGAKLCRPSETVLDILKTAQSCDRQGGAARRLLGI